MYIKSISATATYMEPIAGSFAQSNTTIYPINKTAPVISTKTILIKAKPEEVWKVLTDIDNRNSWLTNISQSKLNGELQPDTTFDWKTGGVKIHSKLHTVE